MEVPVHSEVAMCAMCSQIFSDGVQQVVEEYKACETVMFYHAQKEKTDAEIKEKYNNLQQEFPGPCEIKHNDIFGNYIVAARKIEEGDLICEDQPLFAGPYAPFDLNSICLSCYKDIGGSSKCSTCKWPVCNSLCENVSTHKDNECKIFSENKITHKGNVVEYFIIEVIRCLLSKERDPKKWLRVTQLEPHFESRKNDERSVDALTFITNYLREKCKFDYDDETINIAVGVLSINTFWAHKETQRFASLLFDKISLIAHDCDPNTRREIIITEPDNEDNADEGLRMKIRIYAARTIEKGENISTQYVNLVMPVKERREKLKSLFYFDCCCGRCLTELLELTKIDKGMS